jgi:reactive intermediate/imine deaminase
MTEKQPHKRAIHPGDKSPKALGAYSHALVVGNLLFISGQGCRNPKTGKEVGLFVDDLERLVGYDIEAQTRGVLENLTAVLKEAGLTLHDVVDVTVFLTNMDDFDKYNHVYAQHFHFENPPARTTVQVARLPGKNFIEIKAIAAFPGGSK